MREPSVVIPVTAGVDDDGLVPIEGDDRSLVLWNHRPALLHAAVQRFGGMAGPEATLAPARGPHGSIHGKCEQRVQRGEAR
jgi:hypothetical protein